MWRFLRNRRLILRFFQGTRILGVSRGHLSDSVIYLFYWLSPVAGPRVWSSLPASRGKKKSLYHEFKFMICRPTYHEL